ncbi:hypothetical protein E4L95_08705 [Paracoccus liaowanqingii]|uniref:Uncharacterized protein n=1 Tax=Paracoccus liaowanqingii TaxID=2560053 RepID=A0A4Z1C0M4_9RHOB|nr:hypothetical protein [Paracoccus liaowanqingii]TGN61898.1 hypothetical protein E4L95_08705 [Paracoccus liaowanqingii]
MAKTPINDPNQPRTTDPYATDRPAKTEKKSKVLPIVIGVIGLAILAYFLLGMMSSDDEVETTEPVAETQMDDAEADSAPTPVVVDPVEPEPEVEPAPAVTPEAAPATDTAPATDIEADAAPADVTEESVTVEIVEPDETTAPVEGTETTTVPLQSPEPAPAN